MGETAHRRARLCHAPLEAAPIYKQLNTRSIPAPFEADRARRYYEDSRPLIGVEDRRSRSSLWVLIAIHSRLLDKIRAVNYDVFTRRVSLMTWGKLRIPWHGIATPR